MHYLTNIIKQGESETLEFKPAFNVDVIETAVAFANLRGGRILIGVSDSGQPLHHEFGKEVLRDYVNKIANATEPSIIPDAQRIETGEGEVVLLSIPEFPLKPTATRGRCYRRSGSMTRQMTPSEIAELHLYSTGQSMDAVIVADRTLAGINLDAVRTYMRRATEQGRRSFTETQDPRTVLRKLDLIKSEHEITRAAILLFGKEPQSPLGQAVVHAGRLRQKTHIMDNAIIDGSIIDQVENTVAFIKKNLHVRFEITGDPQRREIWDYPLPAIREAVTNAICHRDYGNITDIQIKIFEDSLIIWSPGLLPFDVSVADLLSPNHSSKPRNKLIAQIFYDMGIIERYGGGIQRILDFCEADALPIPTLEEKQGGFRIIFTPSSLPVSEGVTEGVNGGVNVPINVSTNVSRNVPTKDRVLSLIVKHPGIQRKVIAQTLNITEKTVSRHLATLMDERQIEHQGSNKTGGYHRVNS